MKTLTIDINGTCNLGCEFCYQELDSSQLSADEVMQHIERLQPDVVEIGGGEPTLHDGLFDILHKAAESGQKINLATNGTYIPEWMLNLNSHVRDATTIQVSLHAGSPELYKEITGSDSFYNVIENIRQYKDNYNTQISAAAYQKNINDIPKIAGIAEELNVPLRIALVMPIGKGKEVELLDKRQLQDLRSYLFAESFKGKKISSPLLHFNNCAALEAAYGLQKKNHCPMDCGNKQYVSQRGKTYGCEFALNNF